MTSAERGWVLDHQTQNRFDQTQSLSTPWNCKWGPQRKDLKKNPQNLFTGQSSFSFHNFNSNNDRWRAKPPKRLFPSRLPAPALCVLCLVTQACPTTCDPMDCSPPGSSVHGDSPGKNTGVGCHALLQGIFPTQGLNPDLLHCWKIIYCLNHQGSPRGTQNSIQGAGREGKVKTRRCQPHDLPTLQASEPGKREIGWDSEVFTADWIRIF